MKSLPIASLRTSASERLNLYDRISKRADKGDTPYNLRNCAYLEDFYKQQIIWIELSDEPKFSYAENITSVNTVFFLTGEHVLHILGVLNSKLITWYFKHCIGTTSGVGTNRWLKYTIEQIPIPAQNEQIEHLVVQINSQYNNLLDAKLDKAVCNQYGLSDVEIDFIINH